MKPGTHPLAEGMRMTANDLERHARWLRGEAEHVQAEWEDCAVSDDADFMCPNCVTPWKCNGPHEARGAEGRPPHTERGAAGEGTRRAPGDHTSPPPAAPGPDVEPATDEQITDIEREARKHGGGPTGLVFTPEDALILIARVRQADAAADMAWDRAFKSHFRARDAEAEAARLRDQVERVRRWAEGRVRQDERELVPFDLGEAFAAEHVLGLLDGQAPATSDVEPATGSESSLEGERVRTPPATPPPGYRETMWPPPKRVRGG